MRRYWGLGLMFLLIFMMAGFSSGQESSQQFVEIMNMQIRAGAVPQFEEYMKKVVEAADKVGAKQRWGAYEMALGGPGRAFMVSLPFEKWGEMDSWTNLVEMLSKAHGEKEAAQIIKAGSSSIESYETSVYRLNKQLSTKYERMDPPASFLTLVEGKVKLERWPDFRYLLEKYKAAEEDNPGSGMASRWYCVTGPGQIIVTVRPFQKFADRDASVGQTEALNKMYGEAETQRLFDLQRKCLESIHTSVMAYRPDLSRWASPRATDN